MPLSSSQFGGGETDTPMALGSSTTGTFAQRTAWRNPRTGASTPAPYSKRTAGTTYKWDDDSTPLLPKSDRGAGRNEP